jgi:hypothetical protein
VVLVITQCDDPPFRPGRGTLILPS